jgi:tetratricopeptide (TPR) repeat protein
MAALLVAAAWSPLIAQSPEATFEASCRAYDQGRWDEAAEGFRGLLRYRIVDDRLEYNLANAEYKRGRLGEAILHYERARRLNPSDRDIAGNLAIARAKIRDVIEEDDGAGALRGVRSFQDRLGVAAQAGLVVAGVWLVAGIVTWCGSRPRGFTPAWSWALALTVALTGMVFLSWRASWARLDGAARAVILKPSVEALAGPGLNNASLFTLHEGTTVSIQGERDEWIQVTLPNNLTGWLPRDAAERI